jgi:hypothetical protein
MPIRVTGWGEVSTEQLEAMFRAYLNAGAPKPKLDGTAEEKRAAFEQIQARGDSQMRSLMSSYLEGKAEIP